VTDCASVTGGKELAEISGKHIGKVASAILSWSAFMIIITVRLTEQQWLLHYFFINLQFGLENDTCFARFYTFAEV